MIKLPRLTLRLRLSLSIAAIVTLFTLTNITYQVSSQNRTERLDHLQNAVQGQLASVNIRQRLEEQQKQILVLDALIASGDAVIQKNEIDKGIENITAISEKVGELESYAYTDALDAYQLLADAYQTLSAEWIAFYRLTQHSNAAIRAIKLGFDDTINQLNNFESLEVQTAEQQTLELQRTSRFASNVTLAIYLFTIALTVGLGYLLIRYTTRSLKDLNFGTVRIGRGDLDYHIQVMSNDEIGDLAIAFNDMADKLRNAMAQVQNSKEKADEANLAKTAFLANMSHELRTPLNAIIGYSEMNIDVYREENALDQEQTVKDLQHILNSGRHLLQLINDVLDLSKIESGNMTVFNENFDSVQLINDIVTTMMPLAKKNANEINVESSPDIPSVYTDSVKFRQVFINLLSNACKFTENGKISILITHNENAGELVYHVTDTGVGMTKEQLTHIFEAFVQAESSTSKKYGGTGLGLAICKDFVKLMQGTLDVTSAPDHGTTFTIILPVTYSEKRAAKAIPTSHQQDLTLESSSNASKSDHQADQDLEQNRANPLSSATFNTNRIRHLQLDGDFGDQKNRLLAGLQTRNISASSLETDAINHETTASLTLTALPDSIKADNTVWKTWLSDSDEPANKTLPKLAVFSTSLQSNTALERLFAELDIENRQRLAAQIRRNNPTHRRGKALLVGYPRPQDTHTTLANDLLGEAWQWQYCDDILEAENKATRHQPDVVFINPSQDPALIFQLCLKLKSDKADNRRIYFANSYNESQPSLFHSGNKDRPLDQPVAELLLL